MTYITLPSEETRRLVFYLAMEEYLADHCEEDVFFLWHVEPTVIFGRNQVMEAEVNIEYCEKNHIQYYRRKSGGGCVYADRGNVMLSYITPKMMADEAFAEFLDKLAEALGRLGLPAVKTEHNDVLVEGRKVSGNALLQKEKASIVHGTLLYDEDLGVMQAAITPPKQKLEKHGIASVRQRVANLKELGISLSVEELKDYLANFFCGDQKRVLTQDEIARIKEIEKEYLTPEFIRKK